MRKIGKKGSHVEVILSFVIFVTFLVVLYTIVKPVIREPIDKEYLLNHIKTDIISETSKTLIIQHINVISIGDQGCFVLQNYDYLSPHLSVKNETDSTKPVYTSEEGLLIDSGDLGIYKIYYSDQFTNDLYPSLKVCDILTQEDGEYTVGDKKSLKYVFLGQMEGFAGNYTEEYSMVKDEIGIPEGVDFSFKFTNSDKNTIAAPTQPKQAPQSAEIYSEELPVVYVDYSEKIKTGFLTVTVWSEQ